MSKVFVEYQILPQYRLVYSQWMQMISDNYPEMELLEGVDQPGLFIEVWSGWTRDTYLHMKQIRKNRCSKPHASDEFAAVARYGSTEWQALDPWIQGGASKINVWHFVKAGLSTTIGDL